VLRPIARLPDLDLLGRRVFVRADLDGPRSPYGAVLDDAPLRLLLPTLRDLLEAKATVILAARLSTDADGQDSPDGVAARLGELLGVKTGVLGQDFPNELRFVPSGQLALTPNLSSIPEDAACDAAWAERVARAIDVYVLDGLRAARERSASVSLLPKLVAERGAGRIVSSALDIQRLVAEPVAKCSLVLGGASVRRVLPLATKLLPVCDSVLFGGAVGNTVLLAHGWKPGGSPCEPAAVPDVLDFLRAARAKSAALYFPVDAVVCTRRAGAPPDYEVRPLDRPFGPDEAAVDIAIETCVEYRKVLAESATALWVGLMGDCSVEETQSGSVRVGQAVGQVRRSVVAGDDTVAAASFFGQDGTYRLAPGGDAALALLAGESFPGLDALER
jgi:phosphoglycerate kinase